MNNTFNISRFGLLLRRQWLEFGKIYLISLGVAFGVIASFYVGSLWTNFASGDLTSAKLHYRHPLFLIFGFLFITVIASSYFSALGQKPKTIVDLLIPASTFEKFLAALFFTAVLSVVSFLLIFYLTDLAFVAQLRGMPGGDATIVGYSYSSHNEVANKRVFEYFFEVDLGNHLSPFYAAPAFVTSIFLLGSIYFTKFHYIKTGIAVLLFSGLASYIVFKSGEFLMRNRHPIVVNRFAGEGREHTIELLGLAFLIVLTLIFWVITFVRLREKEV
jgi:hypothetical protein